MRRNKRRTGFTAACVLPALVLFVVFMIIPTINMSFLFVKAMTNGGPDGVSHVFLSSMYQEAYTHSSYGYGMAIGVIVFLFSFALAGVLNAVTKREDIEL